MYTEWTSHLSTEEEKEFFRRQVQGSKPVLERIKQILDNKEAALDRSEMDIRVYDTPNWQFRQAHKNGNRESLRFLKSLINLDQQKANTI